MGSYDVNHSVTAKFSEMIGTDDCIVVVAPYLVYPGLELNYIVYVRLIFNRPVHAATNSTQGELSAGVAAGQLLKHCDHATGIEAAIRKVDVCVDANLQLSTLFRGRCVDSYGGQALQMVVTLIGIDDMNRPVATLEPIFYEGEQDPILFVVAIEESADMTRFAQLGTSKGDGGGGLLHGIFPKDVEWRAESNKDAPI